MAPETGALKLHDPVFETKPPGHRDTPVRREY